MPSLAARKLYREQIRSTVLTALESALDSGQVDSLLVIKTARDAGVPSVDVPPLHGVGNSSNST